jgi:hypothetical protein
MAKQFVNYKGSKYPILWKKKDKVKTDPCPFCDIPHEHGGEGHKRPHCRKLKRTEVVLQDGSTANVQRGYYVLEYN